MYPRRADRRLDGRHAVVTGAASGIGLALAEELGRRGARLTLIDVDAAGLERAARALRAHAFVADQRDAAAVEHAAQAALAAQGAPYLLFLNAGVAAVGPALEAPIDDVRWLLDVNVLGTFLVLRALAPAMRARGEGHIAITASIAGLIGAPGMPLYSASKFALVGLAESLRVELGGSGVSVTTLCPGQVRTGLHHATRYGSDGFRAFLDSAAARSLALDADEVARRALDATLAREAVVTMGAERMGVWLHRVSRRMYVSFASRAGRTLGLVGERRQQEQTS